MYVLLVGAPWYLKGADLLAAAWHRIAPDFPGVRLKIMGHFPDRGGLEALLEGVERVEILPARHYKETLDLIAGASVFVLPSRCEGLPRVLLEAMAAGVPTIGSDVGGISALVRDGENGFLIPAGDADALEQRLRRLLSDADLRAKMGERGYMIAHTVFTESVYVERFGEMIEAVVHG